SIFLFNTSKEGEYVCNGSHSNVTDYRNGKELAISIEEARKQVFSIYNYLRSIPGFENSYLIDSAPGIGLRETRRAIGDYILKKSDVLGNARFEDKIVRCGHPIEVHDPEKGVYYEHLSGGDDSWYEIPYRAIVAKNLNNLFIVGRCLSAEFEAQASARVTGTAIGMGQAAATASYLMISKNLKSAREVNIKELQEILVKNGAIL
ncbi:MAG: FAD-dependent oxidoreductase, partial [Candidatus Micrarchaeia archaeon]